MSFLRKPCELMGRFARGAATFACHLGVWAAISACSMPTLSSDGQLVFTPGSPRGAPVLTANGVEFLDIAEHPKPSPRTSPYDPWRPVTGFLIPRDGRWRHTAAPVEFAAGTLRVTVRTGDRLVPSWGGELLLRIDVVSRDPPASRSPIRLAIVVDDVSESTASLVCGALGALGADDEVEVIDTRGARAVTPPVLYEHRSLVEGAVNLRVGAHPDDVARDVPAALSLARMWLASGGGAPGAERRVLVVTDGAGLEERKADIAREARALGEAGVRVAAAGPSSVVTGEQLQVFETSPASQGTFSRQEALDRVLPPPRGPGLREVTVRLGSAPAPARLIEASAGQAGASLEEDFLFLGDLSSGQARTEILRVTVPPWVPGEPYRLTVAVSAAEVASGRQLFAEKRILLRYSDDPSLLADERNGDVVAYATALSLVGKVNPAFLGGGSDLRHTAAWEASALEELDRSTGQPGAAPTAELLRALLSVL